MFLNLEGNVKKRQAVYSGDLILSIFHGFGGLLMPSIRVMNEKHPNVRIQVISSEKMSRLEYGEAHIAFRLGAKPDVLDYVVKPFLKLSFGLYASTEYIAEHGQPHQSSLMNHRFVGPPADGTKRPYLDWLRQQTTPDQFVLTSESRVCLHQAIVSGVGLGFMAGFEAAQYQNLVEIVPALPQTAIQIWSVTHVDLHRTAKVQEFLAILKAKTS
ncbi:MAG: substrate-binding domain-containing protein [Pseudomonadota bacterium]